MGKTKSHFRRTAEQWQQLVRLQGERGQSQVEFCKAQGLSLSTFQYWERRVGGTNALLAAA